MRIGCLKAGFSITAQWAQALRVLSHLFDVCKERPIETWLVCPKMWDQHGLTHQHFGT